jgi:Tfp pilus assembly protein PilE
MKKILGFTLLEALVVAIIISILSTLAFVQYGKLIERERGRQAFAYLRAIRAAQLDYHIKNNQFTKNIGDLRIPGVFDTSAYFDVNISSEDFFEKKFIVKVTRKNDARSGYGGSYLEIIVEEKGGGVDTTWDLSELYENLQPQE